MQGGRNPNRIQKKKLADNGYDPSEWLYIKMNADGELIFKNKQSAEIIHLSND